jgi:membrane-associated protease RseP (regulator of RpoE activity)
VSETLWYLAGIVFILLGIAFSIGLHELGHLLPAKAFGVKVTKYMIGFGPTLFSRKRGETEYGIKAIPLGGYIAMLGMYPPAKKAVTKTGFFQDMISQARLAHSEEETPKDKNNHHARRSTNELGTWGSSYSHRLVGFWRLPELSQDRGSFSLSR